MVSQLFGIFLFRFFVITNHLSQQLFTPFMFSCGRQCKQNNYFNFSRRKMVDDYTPIQKIAAQQRAKKASLRHWLVKQNNGNWLAAYCI